MARALSAGPNFLRLVRPVSVQPRYSLLFREIERELLPLVDAEETLAVIPYNPLAGGLLTGKYRAGDAPQAGTRFTLGTSATMYQDRYWNERSFATVMPSCSRPGRKRPACRWPRWPWPGRWPTRRSPAPHPGRQPAGNSWTDTLARRRATSWTLR